ncbi:MAG TPA: SIS domain-containing protein [Micromonosporaceae bacterium]|jgi:uncharacterized phosphosugar-binding protein
MSDVPAMTALVEQYAHEVSSRLAELSSRARSGAFDPAIHLLATSIETGGVIHAFGTGHSEAFAMEMSGRVGGLIPTSRIVLRDLVMRGGKPIDILRGSSLERDSSIAADLYALVNTQPPDAFVIASSSGVNGSTVELARLAKSDGHPVIAVTSLAHTMRVPPRHPSGQRLADVADVVIDNLAPYGDATTRLGDHGDMGAVSSITAAYIAQLLTIGVARELAAADRTPPIYLSANIPGGDDHNRALEAPYLDRIRREA